MLPPVTGGDYTGSDAAEIMVIRQIGGSRCQVSMRADGEVVCILPEWGNWTKFTLEPRMVLCNESSAKWEPQLFNIEANMKYYFHVHQRMAEFHKPTMCISEITELEAHDLTGQKDDYKYVLPDGSKQG